MFPSLSPRAQLSGNVQCDGHVAVVTLDGEIDLHSTATLVHLLDEAVATGARQVTVDMTGVTFMGVTALSVFLAAAAKLEAAGRHVAIREVPAHILRVFDVSGSAGTLGVRPMIASSLLEHALASIASTPPSRQVLDASLAMVVAMTQAVMAGADGASITLPRGGQLRTVAASNDVVLEMDHDQYDTGQGPCLDAATQGERFHIESLATENRWPEFVPRARARGIESILSTPLMSGDLPLGALNVYSRGVRAFAVHEKEWADEFAAQASSLMSSASPTESSDIALAGIQDALASREVIALAQGMVMQRDGVSLAAAASALTRMSRHTGQTLRQISTKLVGATQSVHGAQEATSDVRR
ncbi:MAG: anti-sigma factor antagonist [Mycobacteriales bacterium]